ncbi:hypothetical protein [Methylobacterium pseudosasicola]|uniref:Uncharacterized protein n=1 Tax=Methylobacterium pseudosasicola TaxID=582667 RepID=A0A1I4QLU1_9HYPH|nr:hypothetical protein [Methylobacterium pseudosasicola]SFM41011.1 hypothetical protein SAMN05192568_103056 [Methylobacterium pseudosasicola]
MRVIEISTVEALIREALPRATEEEVAFLLARCEGRSLHPDNADLLRPFTRRDDSETRVERIGMLVGCVLTGQRNGWHSSAIHPAVRRPVRDAAARA